MTYLCTFRNSVDDLLLLAHSTCLLMKNLISSGQMTSSSTVYKGQALSMTFFCYSAHFFLILLTRSSLLRLSPAALPPNHRQRDSCHSQPPLYTTSDVSPTKLFSHQPCHHLLDPLLPDDRISRVPHLLIVCEVNSDKRGWHSRLLRLEGF